MKASVTALRNKDGSIRAWWVRGPRQNGKQPSLKIFKAHEEADAREFAAQATFVIATATERKGPYDVFAQQVYGAFQKFGERTIDLRELDGVRGASEERNRFKNHLATAPFASWPVEKITSTDIAQWVRILTRKSAVGRTERTLARHTVQRCLSLASVIFSEAVETGLISVNPCRGLRVKMRENITAPKWGYLDLAEQRAIGACEGIPLADRLAIQFAIGTGLRQGEQFHLRLNDLHADGPNPRVVVRFGSEGKSPKNGKIREVPLFGVGLIAAKRWVDVLPSFLAGPNQRGLVFPAKRGGRRQKGSPLGRDQDTFRRHLATAGIQKSLRWHDLRHTCASSLVAGWWGRVWTMSEISAMLGHSSIVVTQRYAHLGETSLKAAARETDALMAAASAMHTL